MSAASTKRVETFLRAGRFRAASSVAQRYARAIARRFRKHLLCWAYQNEQRIQSANAFTVDAFRRIRLNLDELAVLPRKACGLGIAEQLNQQVSARSLVHCRWNDGTDH
jgi:hypothetical protein